MSDDGILNVVEHIESELQRLGRLVAALRRRIEARQEEVRQQEVEASEGGVPTPVSRVVSTGPVPRTFERPGSQSGSASQRRMPIAIEENDLHDESVMRTATGGSSYGFVREPTTAPSWKKRTLDSETMHAVNGGDEPLDRRTR
jgi:hypothetical protein